MQSFRLAKGVLLERSTSRFAKSGANVPALISAINASVSSHGSTNPHCEMCGAHSTLRRALTVASVDRRSKTREARKYVNKASSPPFAKTSDTCFPAGETRFAAQEAGSCRKWLFKVNKSNFCTKWQTKQAFSYRLVSCGAIFFKSKSFKCVNAAARVKKGAAWCTHGARRSVRGPSTSNTQWCTRSLSLSRPSARRTTNKANVESVMVPSAARTSFTPKHLSDVTPFFFFLM